MGLRDILSRAETTQTYAFMDEPSREDRVVPIPVSLDQRVETLRQLIGHLVEIQAEQARLIGEENNIAEQIHKHRLEFAQTMLDLGVSSTLATESE